MLMPPGLPLVYFKSYASYYAAYEDATSRCYALLHAVTLPIASYTIVDGCRSLLLRYAITPRRIAVTYARYALAVTEEEYGAVEQRASREESWLPRCRD